MSDDPSRTEKPTHKRVNKARQDGSVAKSQDFSKSVVLLVGLVVLTFMIEPIGRQMQSVFIWFFRDAVNIEATPQTMYNMFLTLSGKLALMILPLMAALALTAIIVLRVQIGHLWAPKVFEPKWGRTFDVIGGLKRLMFTPETFVRLGRSLLQAFVVGFAPYLVLRQEFDNFLPLFFQSPAGITTYLLGLASKMILYALLPMVVIGLIDLWYSRWKYTDNLKMTKDEVKDERRQSEGDPHIKNKQKQKMFEVVQSRMMQSVPKADVVITNPTHFAVALRYDVTKAPAPVVVAKGADHLALKIREIARENGVPIRENRMLARALYDQVEIGDVIPETLYQAVATILAQLSKYNAGRKQRANG